MASKTLPQTFWTIPPDAFQHEDTTVLHTELTTLLKEEFQLRNLGVVEMMMVERTAFFYCWVRDRERSGVGTEDGDAPPNPAADNGHAVHRQGFVHERNYKEAIQLLTDMMARLQRTSSGAVDAGEIRNEAMEEHTRIMLAGLETLPTDVNGVNVREMARGRLVEVFEGADI